MFAELIDRVTDKGEKQIRWECVQNQRHFQKAKIEKKLMNICLILSVSTESQNNLRNKSNKCEK
jgi:hypothetical protein